jgi:hypothetical protein
MNDHENPYAAPQAELSPIGGVRAKTDRDIVCCLFSIIVVLLLGALALDFGWLLHYCKIAALVQIILLLLITIRTKNVKTSRTRFDSWIIRWGIFPVLFLTLVLAKFIT